MTDCQHCTFFDVGDAVRLNEKYFKRFLIEERVVMASNSLRCGVVIERIDYEYHIVAVRFDNGRVEVVNCA